jgi:hypothetical protein
MNFLPEKNKIIIKKEYFRRIFIIIGLFFFFLILASDLFLFSFSLLLKNQKESFSRQLEFSEERLARSEAKDIIPLIKDLNEKISLLQSSPARGGTVEKSALMKNILSRKPDKITIKEFLFEKNKISIWGFSDTRDNMLGFINSLKEEKSFKKVESPIANLLKEKDIEFSISIEL